MRMMPSAPVPWTTYGAIPVTRIVPASPMTNAPHQLVPLARPCSVAVPSIEAMVSPRSLLAGPLRAPASGRFVQSSEERQVTLNLPVTHLGVPRMELLALDLGVVVDVVAVRRRAERLAQHVVGDQLVGRMQQRRRQQPDARPGDVLGRHAVRVRAGWVARGGCALSGRPGSRRASMPPSPAASRPAMARYGLAEPSQPRFSTRPPSGTRSIWVRLLPP